MMSLETAMKGMEDAKRMLESREAITSLPILSEQMDRLATYTSAVEEHLAQLELQLEEAEAEEYKKAIKAGKSPSAAETVAKQEVASIKGQIKMLTRKTSSAWRLVGVKQSRWNHLQAEAKGQV